MAPLGWMRFTMTRKKWRKSVFGYRNIKRTPFGGYLFSIDQNTFLGKYYGLRKDWAVKYHADVWEKR